MAAGGRKRRGGQPNNNRTQLGRKTRLMAEMRAILRRIFIGCFRVRVKRLAIHLKGNANLERPAGHYRVNES